MKWLELMAKACGGLAACFLCLIAIIVTGQIIARSFGGIIPSSDDFAAWAMASSVFLALPYAMLRGDHIRVSLLLQLMPKRFHKPYELVATTFTLVLSAWCSQQVVIFVYESFMYNEVAQGMVRVPMWLPQLGMPIGMCMLTAMLARRLLRCVMNQELEATEHG
ncbi:TRAP transporter small permease [Paenalcaligenes niemegkensis]|uniref:TRAP transporter small permease n=1 Tax=Paenalcaligenes niemegkensis TaxID=2895469 RepID=UPI001EE80E1A|nr:TRAP transporter small permease [Paenalcaligenes niemegkensis]MCQ9618067.1 TRAP transporter small permease [Paenalcaligenes niemegkensis]